MRSAVGVGSPGRVTAPGKRTLTGRAYASTVRRGPLKGAQDRAGAARERARPAPTGGGQRLPAGVQAKMGEAFGTDLSEVRVHEGRQARDVGALAYTRGTDIHFAPGQYQPGSQRGQELLGHELAHVVQQSQGRVRATTQAKGIAINDDRGLEREADEMGARAARGRPAGNAGGTEIGGKSSPAQLAQVRSAGPVIQRMPAWDSLERTEQDVYGVDPGSRGKLYGKSDAVAPSPRGLYGVATEDKDGATYKVWTPNVRFTSNEEQASIARGAAAAQQFSEAPGEEELVRSQMGALEDFIAQLEGTLRARIDGNDGSPSTGVFGPNDCRGWAAQLRYLIAAQLGDDQIEHGPEQTDFDLGADPDAPTLSPGDQMTHTFAGPSDCSYHSATVVASDPPSVVTLEAHASKNLTAPEFHVRAGLPGFVADNDTGPDGELRGHGKKGQLYRVKNSRSTADTELKKIHELLKDYKGDPMGLLTIIQKFKTISQGH